MAGDIVRARPDVIVTGSGLAVLPMMRAGVKLPIVFVLSADPVEAKREYELDLKSLESERYDLVLGAVGHREYREMEAQQLTAMLAERGTLADLRGIWLGLETPGVDRWSL